MQERLIEIPIPNSNLKIHGVLRGSYSQPVVVLAHGLGGWMHEMLMFNASRALEKAGLASLRVSFYGYEKNQRNINEYDVKVGAIDIDTIVDYLKDKGAQDIAVVGHSYSGMAILYSRKQLFDVAVLWDPSHTDSYGTSDARTNLENDFIFVNELNSYVSAMGTGSVISSSVFDNYEPGSGVMAKQFNIVTLIINASFSTEMQDYGREYAESINANTKQIIIPNSTHPFVEDGVAEKLFEETAKWISKKFHSK